MRLFFFRLILFFLVINLRAMELERDELSKFDLDTLRQKVREISSDSDLIDIVKLQAKFALYIASHVMFDDGDSMMAPSSPIVGFSKRGKTFQDSLMDNFSSPKVMWGSTSSSDYSRSAKLRWKRFFSEIVKGCDEGSFRCARKVHPYIYDVRHFLGNIYYFKNPIGLSEYITIKLSCHRMSSRTSNPIMVKAEESVHCKVFKDALCENFEGISFILPYCSKETFSQCCDPGYAEKVRVFQEIKG